MVLVLWYGFKMINNVIEKALFEEIRVDHD